MGGPTVPHTCGQITLNQTFLSMTPRLTLNCQKAVNSTQQQEVDSSLIYSLLSKESTTRIQIRLTDGFKLLSYYTVQYHNIPACTTYYCLNAKVAVIKIHSELCNPHIMCWCVVEEGKSK